MSTAFNPSQLEIKKFIFHVVHHGEDNPILMDDTPINGFEAFFKKRIAEILHGNKFHFLENSDFLKSLKRIHENEDLFVDISKDMAIRFHAHQDNRIKPGVMILTKVLFQDNLKYILIKYDHEEVITYSQKGNKALLQEIKNTFSKSKESLQKSAIVEIDNSENCALIIDKSESANITKFFKGFLGVVRKYNNTDLTQKVREAYINTVRKNKGSLPNEYTANATTLFYNTVQSQDNFESELFLQNIFQIHYTPQIKKDFEHELKLKDAYGEAFLFNKDIKRPPKRKLRTEEGVIIQYPSDAEDTVDIKNLASKTVITITTHKLHEENT